MITIAIANQKGGVGKTTTTVNLGAALAQQGKKVLMVDADPQGDMSEYLGCKDAEYGESLATLINAAIMDSAYDLDAAIRHHEEKFDYIATDIGLASVDVSLTTAVGREYILRELLQPLNNRYDYCLIDCMPSLGMLTVGALSASDKVIIPVQAQHFSVKGLEALTHTIRNVQRRINPHLQIGGIVMTMVDKRTNLSKDVCNTLFDGAGRMRVFQSVIPICVKTAESTASGHSSLVYDPSGKATQAYQNLAKEVIQNERTNSVRKRHAEARTR